MDAVESIALKGLQQKVPGPDLSLAAGYAHADVVGQHEQVFPSLGPRLDLGDDRFFDSIFH